MRQMAFAIIVSISLASEPAIAAAQQTEIQPPALVYPGPARPVLRLPKIEPPELEPRRIRVPALRVPPARQQPTLRWRPNVDPRLDLGDDGAAYVPSGR
jgi:hypothetical protein